MKKVFAFLSTIVLTLACVGVALAPVKAVEIEVAPGKFIVDPTVEENEIPMYIMDSIRSTFPNYYDNNAKPDAKWEGVAREFPWNETKLWISQFDATGTATGKFYAPYFTGAATAASSGAGQQIYNFQDDTKGDFTADPSTGKYRAPAQTSLSYVRFNMSDANITVKKSEEPIDVASYIIFDGQGKAVRGLAPSAYFLTEAWTPLHCYAEDDSIIALDENYTGCAKNMVQATDPESGEPVVDEQGNPVMVEDGYKVVTNRILWQYFPEQPANLNENGYLGEGWNQENWDYYLPEYKVAIIYATGDSNWGKLTDTEAKKNAETAGIYTTNDATVLANGTIEGAIVPSKDATVKEYNTQVTAYNTLATAAGKTALVKITATDDTTRAPYGTYEVPARGMFYCYGFLDRGKPDMMAKFNEIYLQGMKFGRSETYNGKVRTYNFSAGNLKVATSGLYTPLDGRGNVIEVLPKPANPFGGVDNKFYPKNNINVTPMATYWAVTDDVTSFKSATSALEYTIKLDGATKVFKYPYADKASMVADFLVDFNAFLATNKKNPTTLAALYDARYDLAGEDRTKHKPFFAVKANRDKWGWMISYVMEVRKTQTTPLAITAFTPVLVDGFTTSTGTFTNEIKAFLNDARYTAWPATSDYTIEPAKSGFLPKATNEEEYNNYFIDPTGAALNTNYVVDITVKNAATAKESSIRLTYVVVDALSPVLTLNPLAFYKTQGQTLDKNTFASAKDAYGNNLSHMIQTEIDWNGVSANEKVLPAGDFNVTVSVEQNGKLVQKTAVLHVTDTQKPVVEVQSLVRVPLGGTFYFTDGIKSAVDNVDGNLFNNKYPSFTPFVNNSDTVDTSKPGRFTIEFEVFDRAGNKVSGQYDVVVAADTSKTVLDALDTIQATLDSIEETVNTPAQQGCAAPAAPAAVTFVATVGLLASAAFVVLRRKH